MAIQKLLKLKEKKRGNLVSTSGSQTEVAILFRRKCPVKLPVNFEWQFVMDAVGAALERFGNSSVGMRTGNAANYQVAFGLKCFYDADGKEIVPRRRPPYYWARVTTFAR